MASFVVFLALITICAAANPFKAIGSLIDTVGDEVTNDVAVVKQPIEEALFFIATGRCDHVKRPLAAVYEALGGEIEPNLDELSIVFQNSDVTITYNISTAAKSIPKSSGFNPKQNAYIFVHGFTSDPSESAYPDISRALFNRGDGNVVALDASSLIGWLYFRSSTYVTYIGKKLGDVLVEMVKNGLDPAQIHIIGHSLGAHISGFAGKQFYEATGSRVGRISGLDPAGPCFIDVDGDKRLNPNDAEFVDVIHSNAGVLGLDHSVGHVDYWPNEGSMQPSCFLLTCSHGRSTVLFAESVSNPEAFPAVKCDSWGDFKKGNCSNEISYMGLISNSSASGNYYLRTGDDSPFGLGINGSVYDDSNASLIQKIANRIG